MNKYPSLQKLDLPWEKLSRATVLVTGGNGMIASAFIEALYELSHEKALDTDISVLCRNPKRAEVRFAPYLRDEHFELIIQDVSDPLRSDKDFDYIIHAASSAHPHAFNNTPVDVMRANFIGTMNLLEYSKDSSRTRFMYVSSSEVYGENEQGTEIFTEDMPGIIDHMRFRACYPESKRAAEILKEEMENAFSAKVKFKVDISQGKSWYDAKA